MRAPARTAELDAAARRRPRAPRPRNASSVRYTAKSGCGNGRAERHDCRGRAERRRAARPGQRGGRGARRRRRPRRPPRAGPRQPGPARARRAGRGRARDRVRPLPSRAAGAVPDPARRQRSRAARTRASSPAARRASVDPCQAGSPCRAPCAESGRPRAGFRQHLPSAGYCRRMGATDLQGDPARRDDMGVSHAADGSAALAPEGRARSERALVRERAARRSADAVEELYRRHWRPAYRAAYLVDARRRTRPRTSPRRRSSRPSACSTASTARARSRHGCTASSPTARSTGRARSTAAPGQVDGERRGPRSPQRSLGRPAPRRSAAWRRISARVVVLRYLLEHTPGEIAEMLDLPRGTVNSRLRRGTRRAGRDGRGMNVSEQLLTAPPAGLLRRPARSRRASAVGGSCSRRSPSARPRAGGG